MIGTVAELTEHARGDAEELSPRTPGLIHIDPDEELTPAAPTGRRLARAVAVQAVYETDLTGHPGVPAARRLAEREGLTPDLTEFAVQLVALVEANRRRLDARIAGLAPSRPVERQDPIDRAILRVAMVELEERERQSAPVGVAVNEAVELAKLYGSESSPRFVNGVLGAMLR